MPCVRFEAQTGKHLLSLNFTAFDPKATPFWASGIARKWVPIFNGLREYLLVRLFLDISGAME